MSKKLIVSTVGTSLLTQHATPSERTLLTKFANHREEESPFEVKTLVRQSVQKGLEQLNSGETDKIRNASAELNGLIRLNSNFFPLPKQDVHFLVATDTFQGRVTANAIKDFLENKCNCTAHVYIPEKLSTIDGQHFSDGVKNLLKYFEGERPIEGYRQAGYEIVFNLSGGFKSLQGFLNTIGQFYADRIIYIFEPPSAELIQIPRLPLSIDMTCFKNHATAFALLAAGKVYLQTDFPKVPESLLDEIDGYVILSLWGELLWNKVKSEIFAHALLKFPFLKYNSSFEKDFKESKIASDTVRLQETLAKVSVLLERNSGSTASLKTDGGILYEDLCTLYEGHPIGHFRVGIGPRVSCIAENGGLTLRHYGAHDDVIKNP